MFPKYVQWLLAAFVGAILTFAATLFRDDGFSDRTIVASMDGTFAVVIQDDRVGIWGPVFRHSRTTFSNIGGVSGKSVETQFAATSRPAAYGRFSKVAVTEDYELAMRGFSLEFRLSDGREVRIDEPLTVTDFVTKTDPDYVRSVHVGSGMATLSGKPLPVRIAVESTAYRRLSAYYLKPDTELNGYFGAVFDVDGTSRFYDLSEMVVRGAGETYQPHAFLLTKRPDGSAERSFDLDFLRFDESRWALLKEAVPVRIFENLRPMGPSEDADRYDFATSKSEDGEAAGVAVLNFFRAGTSR